jgi:hypothetical protein
LRVGAGIIVEGYDVPIAPAMVVGIGGGKVAVGVVAVAVAAVLIAEIDATDIVRTGVVGNARLTRTVRHQEGWRVGPSIDSVALGIIGR